MRDQGNHLDSDIKTFSSENVKEIPVKWVYYSILSNFCKLYLKMVVGGRSVEYFLELRNLNKLDMGELFFQKLEFLYNSFIS